MNWPRFTVQSSLVVTHPSTNQYQRALTLVYVRDVNETLTYETEPKTQDLTSETRDQTLQDWVRDLYAHGSYLTTGRTM